MAKLSLARCDLGATLDKDSYEARLKQIQQRLPRLELAYKFADARAVIAIEGWDAVGKGGVIRRLMAALDPRGYMVWPIGPPTPEEKAQHYLQRFSRRLPQKGTWALFDRTWYGRVLVERVEKFASPAEWRRAYDEINTFERMLIDDGVRIVKLFLHTSREEQVRRLLARADDPEERWKMALADIRNVKLRPEYEAAVDDMLARTSTPHAPWRVIPFEDKHHGRIAALDHVIEVLGKGMDLSPPPLAEEVVPEIKHLKKRAKAFRKEHGRKEHGRKKHGDKASAGKNNGRKKKRRSKAAL